MEQLLGSNHYNYSVLSAATSSYFNCFVFIVFIQLCSVPMYSKLLWGLKSLLFIILMFVWKLHGISLVFSPISFKSFNIWDEEMHHFWYVSSLVFDEKNKRNYLKTKYIAIIEGPERWQSWWISIAFIYQILLAFLA